MNSGWHIVTLLIAALVALPILVPFLSWLHPEGEVWRHLAHTVLGELVRNTLVLTAGVGVGVLVLGAGLAWLTAMCEFPGRRMFEWALMLPLAVPTYVLAFVAIGLLDFSGPLQTALRTVFGEDLRLPAIRSTGGIIVVMVLALYPYVYMLARAAFLSQGRTLLECGRMLGLTPWQACDFLDSISEDAEIVGMDMMEVSSDGKSTIEGTVATQLILRMLAHPSLRRKK